MEQKRTPIRKQIVSLLCILTAGMAAAWAIVGYLLYVYSPTGEYLAANVILDPQVLQNLSYIDNAYGRGNEARFIKDSIVFEHFDKSSGEWKKHWVNDEQYAAIYALLKDDVSISAAETAEDYPAKLEVYVKPYLSKDGTFASHIFQTVAILPSQDVYKVQLVSQKGSDKHDAYFLHPHVYQQILDILELEK